MGLAEEAGRATFFSRHIFLPQVNKLALPILRDKENINFSKLVPLFQIILLRELVGLISLEYLTVGGAVKKLHYILWPRIIENINDSMSHS